MRRSILCFVFLCLSEIGVSAQGGGAHTVELAVTVRDVSGNPVLLGKHDFRVFEQVQSLAKPLAVTVLGVQSTQVKTHLLILLPAVTATDKETLTKQLKRLWSAGWEVNVVDTNGWSSGYVGSAIAFRSRSPVATESPALAARKAQLELEGFEGRRVLFVFNQNQAAPDRATLVDAIREGTAVYHVGGDPWEQQVRSGSTSFIPPPNNNPFTSTLGSNVLAEAPVYERRRGPVTEDKTVHDAVSDALADASGFYQLLVTVPPDCSRLGLQLLTEGKAGSHYKVTARASEQGSQPPVVTILDE